MPDFGSAVSGMAGGAGIGSLFPGVGTIVGAAAGFLGGLFDQSPQEKRDEAIRKASAQLDMMRLRTLERGRKSINQTIQSQLAFQTAGAGRRARSAGANDAEGFILPAQSSTISSGNKALSSFETSTNDSFDRAEANLHVGNALGPVSPSFGDYLLPIGEAAAKYKMNQDYISMLKGAGAKPDVDLSKPGNSSFMNDTGGSTPLGTFGNFNQSV